VLKVLAATLSRLPAGTRVYVQGATGESAAVANLFETYAPDLAHLQLESCLVSGLNTRTYGQADEGPGLTTFMMNPALRPAGARLRIARLSYMEICRRWRTTPPDVAILNLAPSEAGRYSFSAFADFGPTIWPDARQCIGLVNGAWPRPKVSPTIEVGALDAVFKTDEVATRAPATPSATSRAVARHVAAQIPDHATLQLGIGAVPSAVCESLRGHRGLRLWSGLVGSGWMDLVDCGAARATGHVAGVAEADPQLLARLHDNPVVTFAPTRITHDILRLASADRFIAINSALEVDLWGQANLEWRGAEPISGLGGAPEFATAAKLSPKGLSIVALASTAQSGAVSRIVTHLSGPTVSLAAPQIDLVVTEFGTADLRGCDIAARAQRLMAVAAPQHRAGLERAWSTLVN
jgi:acyl-CoA hydrolase